jgi:hypothetical protein
MDNPAPNSVISTVAAIDNAGQYPFWGGHNACQGDVFQRLHKSARQVSTLVDFGVCIYSFA